MNKCKIVFYQTLMISTAILVGLGIQEIIKVYTIGNYSKNRGGSNGY